jgi:hypothetical protein
MREMEESGSHEAMKKIPQEHRKGGIGSRSVLSLSSWFPESYRLNL